MEVLKLRQQDSERYAIWKEMLHGILLQSLQYQCDYITLQRYYMNGSSAFG